MRFYDSVANVLKEGLALKAQLEPLMVQLDAKVITGIYFGMEAKSVMWQNLPGITAMQTAGGFQYRVATTIEGSRTTSGSYFPGTEVGREEAMLYFIGQSLDKLLFFRKQKARFPALNPDRAESDFGFFAALDQE